MQNVDIVIDFTASVSPEIRAHRNSFKQLVVDPYDYLKSYSRGFVSLLFLGLILTVIMTSFSRS